MKTQSIALLGVVCLSILLAVGLAAQNAEPETDSAEPTRWEHLALSRGIGEGLSDAEHSRRIVQLGNEGWELVDVENVTTDGTTAGTVYYFKRPH
jgi:hypothetical protein